MLSRFLSPSWLGARLKNADWERILTLINDRNASICLALHFLFFLALPFSLMMYVSDKMLGGTSTPLREGDMVVLRMPQEVWSGFFWFSNFYGALCGVVIVFFVLYHVWDKGFKADPFLRSAVKAGLGIAVASGLPLKLTVNYLMIMPSADRVPVDILGFVDLAEVAFAPYTSAQGPWFLVKFLITCPLFFSLLALVHWRKAVTTQGNSTNVALR